MSEGDDAGPLGPADADAALAAEYVLRLLDPAEEAATRRREAEDPSFAALVADWRGRLSGWDAEVAPAKPSRALGRRIERRLFGREPSAVARLWASLAFWRGLAAAASVTAAVLAALALRSPAPVPDGTPRLISALATTGGMGAEFLALVEPEAAVLNITRTAGAPAPGRAFELWFVEDDAPPVSLGVLPEGEVARVPLGRTLADALAAGGALAVSDEPAGGSPTGAPTGDVLAVGQLRSL